MSVNPMPDEARAAYAHIMAGLLADENPGVRIEFTVQAERSHDLPHTTTACRKLNTATTPQDVQPTVKRAA